MRERATYKEQEILRAIAAGDQAAFVKLFQQYKDYVYAVAFKLLRNSVLAEEVVQDVFLKIWLKREELGEVRFFPAYLHKVAENMIYPAIRKEATRARHKARFIAQDPAPAAPADPVSEKEYRDLLQQAIRQLPPKQQEAYLLIKEEGLKRQQAADQLQVSPETVKSNLEQAIKRIRSYCLAKLGGTLLFLLVCFHP